MKYLILFLFFTTVRSFSRTLTMEKAPGCPDCQFLLYYTKAQGPNDTLHYMWDFTSKPTVFVALTAPNATASFNWTEFKTGNKSISFDSEPEYTFVLIFNKLIQFNDLDDTGILTPSTENVMHETHYFTWKPIHSRNDTENGGATALTMKGSNYEDGQTVLKGSVFVELTAFGSPGHDILQPRLFHTANSTQCRIILDKLHSNAGYNSTRYAVEFVIVSSDVNNVTSKIQTRMNLDDENSPGIFSVVDLMTPQSQDHQYKGVFLQWRPIAFTYEIPNLVNSTDVLSYNVTTVNPPEEDLKDSLVYKYYGSDYRENLIQQTVVSFGFAQDGFYNKTNYSSWTFTINYGSPEPEKFSLLVIMVMAIGLGFPVALILIGGSYMIARRLRNKNGVTLTR